MSIRCSGFASRSFIIGSRLCPPAMTRAFAPRSVERRDRAIQAARALVLEGGRGLQLDESFQVLSGRRLRGLPMSSRCSYWTGLSLPITGDRSSCSGNDWRASG